MSKRFGVKLGGVTLEELGLFLREDHQHPLLPSTRDNSISIPGRAGAYDFGAEMGTRDFVLPLGVYPASSRSEMQQRARRIVNHLLDSKGRPKTLRLIFDYWEEVYYSVRFSGALPLARLMEYGEFDLPLTAYDPYAYSTVKQDQVTWGSREVRFNSMQYKMGHVGVGTKTVTANTTITYSVDGLETTPLIRLVGSGTNVRLAVNGKSFLIPSLSGTWIIDSASYTATRNGQNALALMQGDFLSFVEGQNNVVITGSNMNFTIYVDVRNKYM